MNRRRWLTWLAIAALFAIALYLRIYGIADRQLLGTEVTNYYYSQETFLRLITPPAPSYGRYMLPFMRILVRFAFMIHSSTFFLRLTSLLFGMASIWLAFIVANRFFGRRAAWMTAVLLTISPAHVLQSQTVKFYATMIVLSLGSLYFADRLVEKPRWKYGLGFGLLSLFSLYNHLSGFIILFANVVFIFHTAWERRRLPVPNVKSNLWKIFGTALAIIVLGYIPYFKTFLDSFLLNPDVMIGTYTPRMYVDFAFIRDGLAYFTTGPGNWVWIFAPLCLFAVGETIRRRPSVAGLALTYILLPFFSYMLMQSAEPFDIEHDFFTLPIYIMFVARGIILLGEEIGRLSQNHASKVVAVVAGLFTLIFAYASMITLWSYYDSSYWRGFRAMTHNYLTDLSLALGDDPSAAVHVFQAEFFLTNYEIREGKLWMGAAYGSREPQSRRVELARMVIHTEPTAEEIEGFRFAPEIREQLLSNSSGEEQYRAFFGWVADRLHAGQGSFSYCLRNWSGPSPKRDEQADHMLMQAAALGHKGEWTVMMPLLKAAQTVAPWRIDILLSVGLVKGQLNDSQTAFVELVRGLDALDALYAYVPQKVDGLSFNYRGDSLPYRHDWPGLPSQ